MPLANGSLTAAELDRYHVGLDAYNAAHKEGKSEKAAQEAARAAAKAHVEKKQREWVESLGR